MYRRRVSDALLWMVFEEGNRKYEGTGSAAEQQMDFKIQDRELYYQVKEVGIRGEKKFLRENWGY